MFRIGFTDINVEQPIIRRLQSLNFFSLFMGLIMSIIVTVLAFLSITLVYSLLMINVETRTFEMGTRELPLRLCSSAGNSYVGCLISSHKPLSNALLSWRRFPSLIGVLRMIGMSRTNLIQLLLTQAMMYAIPGWAAGLVLAQVRRYCIPHLLTGLPVGGCSRPDLLWISIRF